VEIPNKIFNEKLEDRFKDVNNEISEELNIVVIAGIKRTVYISKTLHDD